MTSWVVGPFGSLDRRLMRRSGRWFFEKYVFQDGQKAGGWWIIDGPNSPIRIPTAAAPCLSKRMHTGRGLEFCDLLVTYQQ